MWPGLVKQFFSLIMFSIKFYSEQYLEVIPAVPVNEKPNCFGGFRYFLCGQKKKKHLCSGCHNHYAFRQRHFLVLSTPSQPLYSQYTHWYTFHKLKFLFLIEANSSFSFLKKNQSKSLGWEKGHTRLVHLKDNVWAFTRRRRQRGAIWRAILQLSFCPLSFWPIPMNAEKRITSQEEIIMVLLLSILSWALTMCRHCTKGFTSTFTFNLHNNSMVVVVVPLLGSFFK